jgi:hypothetical protein
MKILADGVEYEDKAPTNRAVMAFEDAMGVTYASWRQQIMRTGKRIAAEVAAVEAATPEGEEPDLSDIDQSLPMKDVSLTPRCRTRMWTLRVGRVERRSSPSTNLRR